MTVRTVRSSVSFQRPFLMAGLDGEQPAGTYVVETDEELVDGISRVAYRRIATRLRLLPDPRRPGIVEEVTIEPLDLTAAMDRDALAES